MLCDLITREGLTGGYDPRDEKPFLDKIVRANKFVLAPDFAQAADELAHDLREVVKAMRFCRLPYPLCWFEVAQAERPMFAKGLPVKEWQGMPTRVGFLLEATRPDLSAWKAHLLWRFEGEKRGNFAAVTAMQIDMLAAPYTEKERELSLEERKRLGIAPPSPIWSAVSDDVKAALSGCFKSVLPDYNMPPELLLHIALASPKMNKEALETLWASNVQDWAGEIQYMVSMLALLNARNASQTELVDRSEYNRARHKRGQPPLFTHHLLMIHVRQKARLQAVAGGSKYGPVRQHFVRGHWKVRKSGIFFWRPYRRGRLSVGEVQKDYVVTS